ncbi:hypothetical protein ODS41_08025 [Pyrobaculum sp. 3827-6]|uniref:hypothetical protein n=1 Tax=Pyrobaculum sp. 3827-6 TaxID=2983604 RepID=UPI0021DB7EA8|nr:hypothetical protein [Pyrobaculum sp. 3827-6]MCU7787856.1 hypothetical protein [Pyrobaculum sp. 3827-6]
MPTSRLLSLRAAVLMYKAKAEGEGKLRVKRRRERGVKPSIQRCVTPQTQRSG